MTLEKLLKKKKKIIQIAKSYGAKNIRVFGSVARGESKKKSDVDSLVDLDSDRNLFDLGGLQMDLQELLGCKVDVVTEGCLREKIRSKIKKEAVSL